MKFIARGAKMYIPAQRHGVARDERLIELFSNKHCIHIDVGNQYDIRSRVRVCVLARRNKKIEIERERINGRHAGRCR